MTSKRCTLGKSCGATCISRLDVCQIELEGRTSESLSAFLARVKDATKTAVSTIKSTISGKTSQVSDDDGDYEAEKMATFDSKFKVDRKITGSKSSFNWEESYTKGSIAGEGMYGFAAIVEGKSKYVVKRGETSTTEAEIIKKAGDAGVGPKLIYAETGKGPIKREYGKNLVTGRIAMSLVPGMEAAFYDQPRDKIGNSTVGDAIWAARAKLHRAGIAHNDAHSGNILIDKKGKARFVDFGLAQSNIKAALSEALGVFSAKSFLPAEIPAGKFSGDFQAKSQPQYGIAGLTNKKKAEPPENLLKMRDNLNSVYGMMRTAGLSDKEISQVVTNGIRKMDNHYSKGVWSKISDDLAAKLIDALYDGVKG